MAYPPRRRDQYSRPDDDFYGPPDDRPYGPPPRRHKSERHRRPSPDLRDDPYARRGHGRREPDPRVGGSSRRARTPPPSYGSDHNRDSRHSRREPREPREPRESRHDRHDRDPASRDMLDRDRRAAPAPRGYSSDPRDAGRPRRSHRDELDSRPRRDMVASPPPSSDLKHKGRDGHGSRSRDYPPPAYGGVDDSSRRRTRSHGRSHGRDVSPPAPRGRDRDRNLSHSTKSSGSARRKSAPAPGPKGAKVPGAKKQSWWQNPLVQAGARTAFSAGAQAVMQNRKDPSPWLGAKGAKVATAALGAALADGLGNRKK